MAPRRLNCLVLAVGVATSVSAACAAPTSNGPSGSPEMGTSIRTFEPFSPDGLNPDITVVREGAGECFGGALSTPRDDAWRCFLGNVIHDPCFASPFEVQPSRVACPDVLSSSPKAVILLNLRNPLPGFSRPAPGPTEPVPFLFQLDNGATCSWITGATASIGGMRVNRSCSDGTSWVGEINRSEALWTVHVLPEDESETQQEGISIAWV